MEVDGRFWTSLEVGGSEGSRWKSMEVFGS